MQRPNTVEIIRILAVAAMVTVGTQLYSGLVRDAETRASWLNKEQIDLAMRQYWQEYEDPYPQMSDQTGRYSWRTASEPYTRNDGLLYSVPPCGFGVDVKDVLVVSDAYKMSYVANTTGVGRPGLNSAPFTPDFVPQQLAKIAHPEWAMADFQSSTP